MLFKVVLVAHLVIFAYPLNTKRKRRVKQEETWGKSKTQALLEFLKANYDSHTAPGKPLKLDVEMVIESFDDIKESAMEFSLYVYLVQRWTDPRLKNVVNTSTVITGKDIGLFWIPDTYCVNARQSDLMMTDEHSHSMIKLYNTGRLTYSRGTYLKTSCLMDLRDFPMDYQKCSVHFSSYGYSINSVLYKWHESKVSIPNTLIRDLAQFVLVKSSSSARNIVYYSGNFTVLTATFEFKRRLGYYLVQVYLPCAILVMLSWIAFWMDKRDTGNRLTVGVTTILTIMFLLSYGNSSVPKMSYIKAMDIYLLCSFAFIFFSLIESVLCWRFENVSSGEKDTNNRTPKHLSANDAPPPTLNENSHWRGLNKRVNSGSRPTLVDSCESNIPKAASNPEIDEVILQKLAKCLDRIQTATNHHETKAKKKVRFELDTFARVIFPVSFVLFNIIYWSIWPILA